MNDDIKAGDIVVLKSGGPNMTVDGVGDYSLAPDGGKNKALCIWFDEKDKRHQGFFDPSALKKR